MLHPIRTHPWDLEPREAIALQRDLARLLVLEDDLPEIRSVAGLDVGLRGDRARAAVVVLSFPELEPLEEAVVEQPITFPYVPGLLSFREIPALLEVLTRVQRTPDVLLVDGQGYAHPRRLGIASHLGILLDLPTIGCAKSRLTGSYNEPGPHRGDYSYLTDRDETIGAVLRTRDNVKPLFVSVGHRLSLATAVDLVLRCGTRYRLPEPTRSAHRLASLTR